MAQRKKPENQPSVDPHIVDEAPKIKELSKSAFNSVVRNIAKRDLAQVDQLRTSFFAVMKDLGVKRDLSKAVNGVPNGSDSFEHGSLVRWAQSLTKEDTKAVKQLVALHATLVKKAGRR